MRHPRRQTRRGSDLLSGGEPVTVVASRVVQSGSVDAFRAWAGRVDDAVQRFPGHRGNIRLEQADGIFHLVYQFDTRDQLVAWEASEEYRALNEEGERFSIARRQTGAGDQLSFDLPGEASAPKWKSFLMTWIVAVPVILSLNAILDLLSVDWPQPVRLAFTSAVLIATLTWLILPWVERWLKTWVLSDADGEMRKTDEA